jgi:hypothetical protein
MHHASIVPQNTLLCGSCGGSLHPLNLAIANDEEKMIRADISLPGFTIRSAKRDRLKRKFSRLQHQVWRSLARRARLDYGAVKLKGSRVCGRVRSEFAATVGTNHLCHC